MREKEMRSEEAGTMRRCGKSRDLLPLTLVGEAGPGDEDFVRTHLHGCAPCREEAERVQAHLGSLVTAEVPDPGEAYWRAFLPRLQNRIANEGLYPMGRARGPWLALSASAGMLILAGALVVAWRPSGSAPLPRLEEIAGRAGPERIREVFEEVYPGSEASLPTDQGVQSLPSVNQMREALDVVLPVDESDIYVTARALPPAARKWFVGVPFRGAV